MPYSLSQKQLKSIAAGHPVSVALPPLPPMIEAIDNWKLNEAELLQWAREQFTGIGLATVESACVTTIWLDCSGGEGGLTAYYGRIVPDVDRHSNQGLPPIPVSVVVCEIVPNGYKGPRAERIQWPGSFTGPTGFGFGGKHEDRFVPVSVARVPVALQQAMPDSLYSDG